MIIGKGLGGGGALRVLIMFLLFHLSLSYENNVNFLYTFHCLMKSSKSRQCV